MRKLIAWVFLYSLDGLLADEGTEYWRFCFGLPNDPAKTKQKIGVYQSAYAHLMGRTAYEAMAGALPTADHPFSAVLNAERKVVFSRTLRTAEWANTTIAAGDAAEEIEKLRRGGDGHIVVWGGVSFWRSLMRLDLIDEFRPPATGPSSRSTAGAANPAADMHHDWQSGERRYLSEGSMAQLKPTSDAGGIAAIDSGE